MGRGNPEGWKNFGDKANNPNREKIPKKDVNKALGSAMHWYKREIPKTDEEFAERLNEFFEYCYENNEIPTVEKLSLALGSFRQKVWEWETQGTKGQLVSDMLKRAKAIISTMDAELAMTGKIQPVVYIFRSKNFYGMRDQVDISTTQEGLPGSDNFDQKALENRYQNIAMETVGTPVLLTENGTKTGENIPENRGESVPKTGTKQ